MTNLKIHNFSLINSLLFFGFTYGIFTVLWQHFRSPTPLKCIPPAYSVRILSYDPLMMYIENFISKQERDYLLHFGYILLKLYQYYYLTYNRGSHYEESVVQYHNGSTYVSEDRTSSSAVLPDGDPIVECIVARASEFQGFTPRSNHEVLQLTRYHEGQEYRPHWDHSQGSTSFVQSRERITTIFAILEASCEKCGTRFPSLSIDWSKEDPRWSQFIDQDDDEGITIKAIPGNALFWKNLDNDGAGDERMLHAGLPPEKGVKTGLNIWTMYG